MENYNLSAEEQKQNTQRTGMFTNEVMEEQIIVMYSRESGMKRDFIHVHEWWKKATVYRLLYKAGEQKPYAGEDSIWWACFLALPIDLLGECQENEVAFDNF